MEFMVKMFDSFDEDYKNHLMQEESNIGRVYRNYILNLEERTDEKDWLISRAANEMINNQLKDKINKKEKQKYSNLIFKIVFNKTAKELSLIKGCKIEYLRNYFTKEELDAVRKVESTIEGLLNIGFEYGKIKQNLHRNLNINLDKFKQ